MIAEQLTEGAENARTGKELAAALNCDVRNITEQIERERRAGAPICAAVTGVPGYYLAADDKELEDYCERLKRRESELTKTRRAMVRILQKVRQQKER